MDLLAIAPDLDREFRRRGMEVHARELRLWMLARRQGRNPRDGWSDAFVLEWLRLMRVPPHHTHYIVRRLGDPCPDCATRPEHGSAATFTCVSWEGGQLTECLRCRAVWISEAPPRASLAGSAA
jgi:hypothetical protein